MLVLGVCGLNVGDIGVIFLGVMGLLNLVGDGVCVYGE